MTNPENPAASIPEAEGAYTTIYRDDQGNITRLDQYVPEVPEGVEFKGIGFRALQAAYPEIRLLYVNGFVDSNEGGHAVLIDRIKNLTVTGSKVSFGPGVLSENGSGVVVNQRVGVIRPDGKDTALSLDGEFWPE